MPDALAKTIPIWCAVMNRLLFGKGAVLVPEHVVGESERAQMQERLERWVDAAKVGISPLARHNCRRYCVAHGYRLST